MRLLRFIALVFASLFLLSGMAQAEPRVALVIGNSSYGGDLGQLPNPANDARLMAKTLKSIGFEVIEAEDADLAAMKRKVQDFGERLATAGTGATGLFFYAGHGLQVGGTNYLIPIHAKIAREPDVEFEAVPVDLVMKQMAFAESAVNIVILDACRNNPLSRGFRAVTRGLADPSIRPMGSFIAYSTAPGDVAEDGKGGNSPYTTALAAAITKPGASINDVFQEVRGQVLEATDKKQVPWDASSLTAPFYFVPAAAASAPAATNAVDPKAIELAFWDAIKDSKSAEDYQAYLDKYPDGDFAPLARLRAQPDGQSADRVLHPAPDLSAATGTPGVTAVESAFWDAVEADASAESYQAYLNKYPKGVFASRAEQRLAALQAPAPAAAPPLPDIVAVSAKLFARDQARLREAPSGEAKIVTHLAANTELEATGRTTDEAWWRVKLASGQVGFVAASAVTDQPPPPAITPPPVAAPEAPQESEGMTVTLGKPPGDDKEVCGSVEGLLATDREAACRRLLEAGIADDTPHYNVLMDLGRALYDQERYEDALQSYRAAVDIDPEYFGAFYMIGRVNLDRGATAEARVALERAVALDPKQADSLFYLGAAQRRLGDFDAALANIERAVKMKPEEPDYAEEVGLLLLSKGKIADAVVEADRAAVFEPDGFMIASMFAYHLGGRDDDALAMADRGVAAEGNWAYWWIWEAMIQRAKGDAAGAQQTLGEAQRQFTDWPRPVIDFMAGELDGEGLRRAGRSGDAREQKQRRCELEFYIGVQAALAGDKPTARAAFRRVQGTRVYEYIEYMVAPAFLAALEPG
ncbi:caspase family protein [Dongia sp.]|uniref:caspase family protein n=1 Tax=Dongia sp. TaxID=1977262 RepID=UPI003750A92D